MRASTRSGRSPNTLDSLIRTALPPTLTWMTFLMVWSRKPDRDSPESAARTSAALQVPSHRSGAVPASGGAAWVGIGRVVMSHSLGGTSWLPGLSGPADEGIPGRRFHESD